LRNLKRRLLRTILTSFGITIAISSFIVLVSMSRGVEKAWVNSLLERGVHMLALSREAVEMLTAAIDENLAMDIKNIDGVNDVSGELVNLVKLENDFHALLRGWPKDSFLWDTVQLKAGDIPGPMESHKILIGETISEISDIKVGDTLKIRNEFFIVSGINVPAGTMNNSAIIFHLDTLQKLMEKERKVNEFHLKLDHPDNQEEVQRVQERLNQSLPNLAFIMTKEIAEKNDILKIFRNVTWATSLVAMFMALFFILNTLLMSVSERTKEIGILNALGWHQNRILLMIVIEGIIMASIGAILGSILGMFSLFWLLELPKLRGFFEPGVSVMMYLEVFLITLFLGIFGSFYPAFRAIRLNPVDSLKYE